MLNSSKKLCHNWAIGLGFVVTFTKAWLGIVSDGRIIEEVIFE